MLSKLEVDKIFKRKCDNTSQTSTQSNNKRQKIYPQHNDHSYAKNIIIDLVNDDCLSEIFMYLPICERPKIAQVCKKWNRVVFSYCFKVKKLVLSHWEYDRPQNILEQFKKSEKKFSFLRSLLDKSCTYLTELDLVAYDNSNIVPLLNEFCPNLVKLRLRLKYFFDKDLENAFSRMSQLRVLKIIFQGFCRIPVILLVLLKNVVNTLNELILISQSNGIFTLCRFPYSFAALICQFKALKKIETGGMLITRHISEAIADAELNFYYHEHVYGKLNNVDGRLSRVMNNELTSITLIRLGKKYPITDDNLYNFANSLKFLEFLIVHNCSLVTDVGIQAITKMKHLKKLFLTGKNNVTDTPLKLLKEMERLILPDSYKITNNSIEKILENSPHMYELSFKHTNITPEFLTIVGKVSEKRKINMRLYVQFSGCCVDAIKHQYLDIHCGCDIHMYDSLKTK